MDYGFSNLIARTLLKSDHNSKTCSYCGLSYREEETQCPHCRGGDDQMLQDIKAEMQKMKYQNIKYILGVLAVLVGSVLLLSLLI